jgi:hypothetical protein
MHAGPSALVQCTLYLQHLRNRKTSLTVPRPQAASKFLYEPPSVEVESDS